LVPLPLLVTATSAARVPVGGESVSVLPVMEYPVTPKFRPPTVIASPRATTPAVPLK